jgi:hypothetical protein
MVGYDEIGRLDQPTPSLPTGKAASLKLKIERNRQMELQLVEDRQWSLVLACQIDGVRQIVHIQRGAADDINRDSNNDRLKRLLQQKHAANEKVIFISTGEL